MPPVRAHPEPNRSVAALYVKSADPTLSGLAKRHLRERERRGKEA